MPAGHEVVDELALVVERGVGLGDDVLSFLDRRKVLDLVGHPGARDLPVWGLDEAVLVGPGIDREGVDEPDVRPLRGLDGAHPAVVGGMNIPDFEPGPLAGQAARAEGGDAPLVRDFRKGVVLIHELRELARAEELLDHRRHRLGVDELLGHQVLGLRQAQPFADRSFDAHQADSELVLGHLADASDAPIAEMVDVVHLPATVPDLDEGLEDVRDIPGLEHISARRLLASEPPVELHSANGRKVVALGVGEEVPEHRLRGVAGRRLSGTHHPVDLDLRLEVGGGEVLAEGVGKVRPLVHVVDVQDVEAADAFFAELRQGVRGDHLVRLREHLPGLPVHDIAGKHLPGGELIGYRQGPEPGLLRRLEPRHVTGIDPPALLHDDVAVPVGEVKGCGLAAPAVRHEENANLPRAKLEAISLEKDLEDLPVVLEVGDPLVPFLALQGPQQHGGRELAPPVDAHEHEILRIELEVEPRPAVGDHPGGEQQLPRGMGLALVVLEEHARGTVELRHDDPFGAVDDQCAGVGHERNLAHVHLLLAQIPHAALLARAFLVEEREAQAHAQRRRVGETPNLAFLHVEERVLEPIFQELELGIARIALDWKHRLEGGLQPDAPALLRRNVRLQEVPVRIELRREEERNLENTRALAEIVANALLFGEGVGRRLGEPVLLSPAGLAVILLVRRGFADRLQSRLLPDSSLCRTTAIVFSGDIILFVFNAQLYNVVAQKPPDLGIVGSAHRRVFVAMKPTLKFSYEINRREPIVHRSDNSLRFF